MLSELQYSGYFAHTEQGESAANSIVIYMNKKIVNNINAIDFIENILR